MRQKLSIREILMLKRVRPNWEPTGVNKETYDAFIKAGMEEETIKPVKKVKKVKQTLQPTETGEIFPEVEKVIVSEPFDPGKEETEKEDELLSEEAI